MMLFFYYFISIDMFSQIYAYGVNVKYLIKNIFFRKVSVFSIKPNNFYWVGGADLFYLRVIE
ncbi:hypothetical protein ECA0155 [Pectobacterium atrosepticum SCRI1043]|uniref:Uncharacterized protein n=1 Tax=Pectobacterium atrosepticum (strain SCRI 1043 / ATCC BAA-672) TaxID=218491 RepID=Q6DAU7_PECAS|nr:hypothetical protein ECA0155 [Pectobacterium atrosepticum SCRI1043]